MDGHSVRYITRGGEKHQMITHKGSVDEPIANKGDINTGLINLLRILSTPHNLREFFRF